MDLVSRRLLSLRLALLRRKLGEILDRHSEMQTRSDDLRRSSVLTRERRSQCLVTSDDLVEALLERRDVEIARETHGRRQIVESAVRLQLIEKPQSLLSERQRQFLIARDGNYRREILFLTARN